ncbi:p10 [Malus domestica virus A]|uniref:p10 n=1 Tax=Malus domestica virus A TaxID=2664236 RepID=A0A5Q0TYN9_9CLOS|nr:p10 [Malus domestica virus A]QGA73178.1 p10 [Malus domestica virus A]
MEGLIDCLISSEVELEDFQVVPQESQKVFRVTLFFGDKYKLYYISNNKDFLGTLTIIKELHNHNYFLELLRFLPYIKEVWN